MFAIDLSSFFFFFILLPEGGALRFFFFYCLLGIHILVSDGYKQTKVCLKYYSSKYSSGGTHFKIFKQTLLEMAKITLCVFLLQNL